MAAGQRLGGSGFRAVCLGAGADGVITDGVAKAACVPQLWGLVSARWRAIGFEWSPPSKTSSFGDTKMSGRSAIAGVLACVLAGVQRRRAVLQLPPRYRI